jgi:hypothetical protein
MSNDHPKPDRITHDRRVLLATQAELRPMGGLSSNEGCHNLVREAGDLATNTTRPEKIVVAIRILRIL